MLEETSHGAGMSDDGLVQGPCDLCRAVALEDNINVWRNKVETMGLRSGRGFERSRRQRFTGRLVTLAVSVLIRLTAT